MTNNTVINNVQEILSKILGHQIIEELKKLKKKYICAFSFLKVGVTSLVCGNITGSVSMQHDSSCTVVARRWSSLQHSSEIKTIPPRQLLTLMMTSAQVVETPVNVTLNSPSQDYTHPEDRTP